MFNLGVFCELGRGVAASQADAFRWFLMAAERGDPDAQCRVSTAYDTLHTQTASVPDSNLNICTSGIAWVNALNKAT